MTAIFHHFLSLSRWMWRQYRQSPL